MEIIDNLHYNLGSNLDDVNIDLELRQSLSDKSKLYSSHRYSEIYLFGKKFESICYLGFTKNILNTIDYRFPLNVLEYFRKNINKELPLSKKLREDPFVTKNAYATSHNNVYIALRILDNNFFLLRIANKPDLPRIKKTGTI